MKVGLIDVDSHNFPNLPLMKIAAHHKALGDSVEWYSPLISGHMDRVYMSKVFSFSADYEWNIDADEVIQGGSGYAINLKENTETYDKSRDVDLPQEIEHIMPDYSIYGITDTAYGFMTRGCPRACAFCHVANKEGVRSHKVADLEEWWTGQKNIVLLDPNILAAKERKDLLEQLIESKARVDFNQGLDIRMMTEEIAHLISKVKTQSLHFAWDRIEDEAVVLPKFEMFRRISTIWSHNLVVYVLCGFDTDIAQDLHRIYKLRDMGFKPYVMLYDKEHIPRGHELRRLQRWVNNSFIFYKVNTFEEYGGTT